MRRVTRSSAKTGDDAARARMRAGSGPSAVRSSSHLDVIESHPEWLGAPFIEEAECLHDTNETAWRWGHLDEITGTGGAVFDNVHDARLSDSHIRGFERIRNGIDWGWFPNPWLFVRGAPRRALTAPKAASPPARCRR